MTGGFRYIAGGIFLVFLVFAIISTWPVWIAASQPASPPVAAANPTQPANIPAPAPVTRPVVQSAPPAVEYRFTEDLESTPPHPGWLYTQDSTILRIKPGGIGFPPPSLNNAPLTLAKGTRVWPRETEGDWVMIKSPGGRLGWVRATELDNSRPYIPPRD